jgi:hypothetical protein
MFVKSLANGQAGRPAGGLRVKSAESGPKYVSILSLMHSTAANQTQAGNERPIGLVRWASSGRDRLQLRFPKSGNSTMNRLLGLEFVSLPRRGDLLSHVAR